MNDYGMQKIMSRPPPSLLLGFLPFLFPFMNWVLRFFGVVFAFQLIAFFSIMFGRPGPDHQPRFLRLGTDRLYTQD